MAEQQRVHPKFDPKRSNRSGNEGLLHPGLHHPGYSTDPRWMAHKKAQQRKANR